MMSLELSVVRAEREAMEEKLAKLKEKEAALDETNTKVITRSAWQKLTAQESTDFFKAGGCLVDD